MRNNKYSLYTALGLIIVVSVVAVMTIHSSVSYLLTKNKIIEEIKQHSKNSITSLKNNISSYIEAYAANEYESLIFNEMDDADFYAIIVKDYNMGMIIGADAYISGKIRNADWNIIDYNPRNNLQNTQLEKCFYTDTSAIISDSGNQLGTITICSSDRTMNLELKNIIIQNIINTALISLLLILSLFFIIRRFVLIPVSNIVTAIDNVDEGGMPLISVATHGSREITTLATSLNEMVNTIRRSRLRLEEQNKKLLKLSHAVEQSSATIIIADINGNIEYVNSKFVETTGYSAKEVIGKTPRLLKSGHTSQEEYKALWETITAGKEWHGVFHNKRKDGTLYWEFASISPIKAEDGTIINFIATKEDITRRKHAEEQLIQSSKLATLGEMATGIAHELNQPLNIIHMAAESLLEEIKDGDVPTDILIGKLERIEGQTDRASAIINHMRTFGRMDSKELEVVDLKEAVQGAVELVGEQMRLSEIEISVNLPVTCRKIIGHQLQLEQVVLNMLTNARDAIKTNKDIDKKSQRITISIEDDPQSEEVKLTVQDTGGGIPDEVLDRIFEPFFTTKEVGQGTGLGLSISYGIITEMGGHIEASNVDGGAKLRIIMPAASETPE